MTLGIRLAEREPRSPAIAGLLAAACLLAAEPAMAQPARAGFFAEASLVAADPRMIWQIMLGGFVIFALLTAVIVWVMTALRKMRMSHKRRMSFINSSLNRISQGIVM